MSVIPFEADDIKTLEIYARDVCGDHVGGSHWAEFYTSNRNEYAERYERRSLTDTERYQSRREYVAGRPHASYSPKSVAELMERLQRLFYNCGEFTGPTEKARRLLLDCVAFELMTEGGPAVYLDTFASVQRVDFDTYRMTTSDPRAGLRAQPYTLAAVNRYHPYEGHTTTDPRDLFRMVWEMHDDCAADYREKDAAYMADFIALLESGKTYRAAQLEMLKRQSAAN